MAAALLVAGSWDFATMGTTALSFNFTDSAGAHGPVTIGTTGRYEHGIVLDTGASVSGLASFGAAIETAMQTASPTKTFSCVFSLTTGLYTLSVNSGNLAVTWVSGQSLLGFDATLSAATSHTATFYPTYVIVPAKPGPAVDTGVPARTSGASKVAFSSNGQRYVRQPTSIVRQRSWEHHYEPKERVDYDWYRSVGSSTHLYTWEQLWQDYGTARMPIGMLTTFADGNLEYQAFSLRTAEYDKSVCQRMRPNDDARWKIHVDADLWPTAIAGNFARTFNP